MLGSLLIFRIITLIILLIGFIYKEILGSLLILSFMIFANIWAYIFNFKYFGKDIKPKFIIKLLLSLIYIFLSILLVFEFPLRKIHLLYLFFVLLDILFLFVDVSYISLNISSNILSKEIEKLEEESNEPVHNLLEAFNFKRQKSKVYMILGYNIIIMIIADITIFILSIFAKNTIINFVMLMIPMIILISIQYKLWNILFKHEIGLKVSGIIKIILISKPIMILVYHLYYGLYFEEIKVIITLLLMLCYFTLYLFFVHASKEISRI